MNHSVNDISVNQYTRSLKALKGILQKAQSFAQSRKFDENLLLQLRMAPDMFPLVKQVQIASDVAKATVAKLSGKTAPVFSDDEKTMTELIARVDKTISFLQEFKNETFKEYAQKQMTFPWYPGMSLMGEDYLSSYSIPNVYFHITTTYNLLRMHGVELGKADFLGDLNWKKETP